MLFHWTRFILLLLAVAPASASLPRPDVAAGSATPLSESFTFTHNAASQRQRITLADGSYWVYTYDDLGQLETANKYLADDTLINSQSHTFNHDNIGNRTGSAGVASASSSYTPNALNQYTEITNSGAHWITGEADPAATVTVDDISATRPGGQSYFEQLLNIDNSAGPAFAKHKVKSVLGDEEDRTTRYARVPAATITPQYDADGNLTHDSFYQYTWDGEDRLIAIESRSDILPTTYPHHKLEFAYDSASRRIEKKVFGLVEATWQLARHKRFLYDGWNLLAEYEPKSNSTWQPTSSYLWGKDLSGTMQDAGGTSGLLHIRDHAEESGYFVAYDGKGNVSALVDEQTGETAARYAYTPFGQLAEATGEAAHLNPFRFSTRYQDTETGLYYYGYRFYDPEKARWLSRDPLGESGGLNLYGFVGNDPVNSVDYLGLALYAFDGTNNDFEQQTHIGMLAKYYVGDAEYLAGVGRDVEGINESAYDKLHGSIGGLGGKARVQEMYDRFLENYKNGDRTVDIIGFSRGAALALDFANKLHEEGYVASSAIVEPDPKRVGKTICRSSQANREPVQIRYMGLFDVVGSFGAGGNDVNLGYNLTVPPNVRHVAHAVAGDELRPMFPLTRLGGKANEVAFNGDHSDIGGGHRDDTGILSRKPLFFIINEGKKVGVPFGVVKERDYIINLRPHNLSRELKWKASNFVGLKWSGNSLYRKNLPPFDTSPVILP